MIITPGDRLTTGPHRGKFLPAKFEGISWGVGVSDAEVVGRGIGDVALAAHLLPQPGGTDGLVEDGFEGACLLLRGEEALFEGGTLGGRKLFCLEASRKKDGDEQEEKKFRIGHSEAKKSDTTVAGRQ